MATSGPGSEGWETRLNPRGIKCGLCGEVAKGSATIGSRRFCHPDDASLPDCYTIASRGAHASGS